MFLNPTIPLDFQQLWQLYRYHLNSVLEPKYNHSEHTDDHHDAIFEFDNNKV